MAQRTVWLACILFAWAGLAHALVPTQTDSTPAQYSPLITVQDQLQNNLSGPDESPACAAVGGIGSDTDCRRNGVQIDPNSGQALSADDQCTSVGGTVDGEACFRDGTQIDPDTGNDLQPSDPGYVPQQNDDQNQQDQAAPDQDQGSQDEMAPQGEGSLSGEQNSAPPEAPSSSSSDDNQ